MRPGPRGSLPPKTTSAGAESPHRSQDSRVQKREPVVSPPMVVGVRAALSALIPRALEAASWVKFADNHCQQRDVEAAGERYELWRGKTRTQARGFCAAQRRLAPMLPSAQS